MLKRTFVSSFHFLKSKGRRFYYEPYKKDEYNKIALIQEKYDIPKEFLYLMKEQEKSIKEINNILTNQQKVIEKMDNKIQSIQSIQNYSYDLGFFKFFTLFYVNVILFSNHESFLQISSWVL